MLCIVCDLFGCNVQSGEARPFPETDTPVLNNNSADLREWAARCKDAAASASSENERTNLIRKCEALRALADSEDWLTGQLVDRDAGQGNGSPIPPDEALAAE